MQVPARSARRLPRRMGECEREAGIQASGRLREAGLEGEKHQRRLCLGASSPYQRTGTFYEILKLINQYLNEQKLIHEYIHNKNTLVVELVNIN